MCASGKPLDQRTGIFVAWLVYLCMYVNPKVWSEPGTLFCPGVKVVVFLSFASRFVVVVVVFLELLTFLILNNQRGERKGLRKSKKTTQWTDEFKLWLRLLLKKKGALSLAVLRCQARLGESVAAACESDRLQSYTHPVLRPREKEVWIISKYYLICS